MEFFRGITEQLRSVWNEASIPARVGFGGVAALLFVAIAAVGYWSSQPEYVPLANSLSPTDAAELISKLEAQNIPHKMNYSGSAVLVPQTSWNQARLVAGDILTPESSKPVEMTESIMSDPTLNHYRILRNREEQLARTLARMSVVESAKVHIGRPDPSPFIEDAQNATASVVLELRKNSYFTREQVSSVVALVANSTEGLAPDDVSVMDTTGKLLTDHSSGPQADVAGQYEFRRRVETDLAAKAETMLAEMLGPGKAVVRVTADIDFTEMETVETKFDPESKATKSEKIRSVSRTGTTSSSGGAAGIASNVGLLDKKGDGGLSEKEEDIETEYNTAQTVDTVRKAAGAITRLTIAATVDLPEEKAADPASTDPQTPPAVTKDQVEAIIKQAVGFDAARSDAIEVVVAPLIGTLAEPEVLPVAGTNWSRWLDLAKNASLGLASIAALVLGFMTLKRMKPVEVQAENTQQSATANPQKLGEIVVEARDNPQLVSQIIASWLNEEVLQKEEETDEVEAGAETSTETASSEAAPERLQKVA